MLKMLEELWNLHSYSWMGESEVRERERGGGGGGGGGTILTQSHVESLHE